MKQKDGKLIFSSGKEIKVENIRYGDHGICAGEELYDSEINELSNFMIERWVEFKKYEHYLNQRCTPYRCDSLFGNGHAESKKNIKSLISIIQEFKEKGEESTEPCKNIEMRYLEIK